MPGKVITHHIDLSLEDGARYCIVGGDPARVEKIAQHLDNPRFVASKREYTTWAGTLEGERVLIMSHGIGGPSAAIAVEELNMVGVDTIIRTGTSGGMAEQVLAGDIVVANSAIRLDGTTKEYAPIEFPAVATLDVSLALRDASLAMGLNTHTGMVQCKDSFYGQNATDRMPVAYELLAKWGAAIAMNCLASEMESSTIFVVGQYLRMRTGCVLLVAKNQERLKKGLDKPGTYTADTTNSVKVAVEGLRIIIKKDLATK